MFYISLFLSYFRHIAYQKTCLLILWNYATFEMVIYLYGGMLRKSRGGFHEGGGHNIKCPPPRFCGRTIFRRKNRIFYFFVFYFLAMLACQNVGVGPTGTPNLSLKNCLNADGAAGKKSFGVPPPPPANQLFWELRDYGLAAVRKNHYVPPPVIRCRISALGWGTHFIKGCD